MKKNWSCFRQSTGVPKLMRKMKLSVFFLFVTVLGAWAADSYSQSTKLTLEINNSTVKNILSEIEENSEFRFFYSGGVDLSRKTSISIKNSKISNVLSFLFNGTDVKYEVRGKQIALFKKGSDLLELSNAETQSSRQQKKTIAGKVTDKRGDPLPGVTIIVKGTQKGIVTDMNGKYTLSGLSAENILVFSFVGMKTQEVKVEKNTSIDVVMEEDAIGLEEVVAIGYGTMKKKDLTGAVTSVKSEDITVAPTNNVMEALQGKISGMDIVKTSGQVGSDVEILLRGSRSIYGDNSPLFIIDGVPGSYDQINPNDIESVDVLKDASSTAIYGSTGSNGVIIITTKRGSKGKMKINFDAYYGVSGTPKFLHGMTGDEWTTYQKEAYKYINGSYPADMSSILTDATMLEYYENDQWIDWVDEAIGKTVTNQKYNLSVTSGSDKTKMYAGISYAKDEGLLENEKLERYALRLNIDQKITDRVNVGFTTNVSYQDMDKGYRKTFTAALSAFPLGEAYDKEGKIIHEYANGQYSPLSDLIENQYVNTTRSMYTNAIAFLEVLPFQGMSIKTLLNGTLSNSRLGQYWGEKCNASRPTYAGSPHASITNSTNYSYTWENIASYKKTIAEEHDLGLTFVTSWSKSINENSIAGGSGQELDSWSFYRLASAASQHVESSYSKTQKMSFAARLNYSFRGKYLLTFSNRWDGVSWLSEGHKWDFFPAGAFAWRISDENFMYSAKTWLDNLKLRIGYGVTGNAGGVGAYSTQTNAYAYTGYGVSVNGKIASFTQYTGTYGNPGLGWEKSYNLNIGLDFAVFNGRIDGAVEYFDTQTKDLLFKRTMPITSGVTGWGSPLSSWENIASTSNNGVELTLNTVNIQKENFKWNSTLSLTWSKEKIKELPSGDLISECLFEGEPIQSFYGYKYEGIWGTNASDNELSTYGVRPGWVKVQTLEKDGDGGEHKYCEDDRQVLGHKNPDYIVGFNNTFSYKSFDLSIFLMGRFGQTIQSDLLGWYTAVQRATTNQPSGIDYWTESNQGAYFPTPGSGNEQDGKVLQAFTYQNGSFVKVKNITLGYTLPKNISGKVFADRCRIYATAYNPFIWVKSEQLKETDPETNGSDSFPLYKQFVFGVNISF